MKVKEVSIHYPNGNIKTYKVGRLEVTEIISNYPLLEIYFTDGFIHVSGIPYIALG